MLKVIIVDDEPGIREGLRLIIDWEKLGFKISGEASNGREALLLIEKVKPDLVITDIMMPEVSGIELIESCREKELPCSFIILSGHGEFELARKALRLEVSNYILKPIDEEELEKTLINIHDKHQSEISTKSTDIYYKKAKLKELLKPNNILDEKQIKHDLNLENTNLYYYLIIDFHNLPVDTGEAEKLMHNLLNFLEDTVFIHEKESFYGMIIDNIQLKKYNGSIHRLAMDIISSIFNKNGMEISIYIGTKQREITKLYKSREEALEIVEHRYYYEKGSVLEYALISGKKINNSYQESNLIEKIKNSIINKDTFLAEDLTSELTDYFIKEYLSADIIHIHLNKFLNTILEALSSVKAETDEVIKAAAFIHNREHRIYLHSLNVKLTEIITEAIKAINNINKNCNPGKMLKNYIDTHYKEILSLKYVADKLNVNPAYLGQVFRKDYGIGFNDYLHNKRLDVAKESLENTNLKIYEIAELSGYTDVNYFMKKFETTFGIPPGKFRKNIKIT